MSSNPVLFLSKIPFRSAILGAFAGGALVSYPLAAQDDNAANQAAAEPQVGPQAASGTDPEDTAGDPDGASPSAGSDPQEDQPEPLRINLSVTVPRGEVNEAQARECEDDAEAGQISGEIIVCRRLGESGENSFSGSREEARKRYARETAFKGAPAAPDTFGIGNHGNSISLGGVPPPALIIDVGALPKAPAGSDADRIARGLPPLGQDENLSEDEIRKRREKLGLPPPAFEKRPK